jgi:hypothetical protein
MVFEELKTSGEIAYGDGIHHFFMVIPDTGKIRQIRKSTEPDCFV